MKAQKLTSITGVGARTAALVLAQVLELGQLNRRQAAVLGGLAPFNRDSSRDRRFQSADIYPEGFRGWAMTHLRRVKGHLIPLA